MESSNVGMIYSRWWRKWRWKWWRKEGKDGICSAKYLVYAEF
jgi:hypothetical protein